MILRGIHIENWSCIGRATLADCWALAEATHQTKGKESNE